MVVEERMLEFLMVKLLFVINVLVFFGGMLYIWWDVLFSQVLGIKVCTCADGWDELMS